MPRGVADFFLCLLFNNLATVLNIDAMRIGFGKLSSLEVVERGGAFVLALLSIDRRVIVIGFQQAQVIDVERGVVGGTGTGR